MCFVVGVYALNSKTYLLSVFLNSPQTEYFLGLQSMITMHILKSTCISACKVYFGCFYGCVFLRNALAYSYVHFFKETVFGRGDI